MNNSTQVAMMTRTQARLVVRNHEAYSADQVREAAVWLLGSMSATAEDVQDAAYALNAPALDQPSTLAERRRDVHRVLR